MTRYRKYERLPTGLTVGISPSGREHYVIALRIVPTHFLPGEPPQTSMTVHAENYEEIYQECLGWLDVDPSPFPYSWDEFIGLFGLRRKQITKEVLVKST